jgi:hypothetical protein
MILRDNADPNGRTVEVRVVEGNGFLEVRAAGYGERTAADGHGSVLALEVYEGRLRLLVFSDINVEGPTHTIDLEGAREDRRHE